jgi:UDP-N-acetylmuramate dehydrogenase
MTTDLPIQTQHALQGLNTFGIDVRAAAYLAIDDPAMLALVRTDPLLAGLPRLILGGGSNLLLTGDFPGLVLHMVTRGIAVVGRDANSVLVRAAAGEGWHALVQWTLAHGLGGLENLSLIPGSIGAAPIQNIGAYGVEVGDCIRCVRYFDFDSGSIETLDASACGFGYRDSVFKHHLRQRAVILDVTFALPLHWNANLQYAELADAVRSAHPDTTSITPEAVSAAVIAIRRRKLPDPAVIGNAGSFFKNPVVSAAVQAALLQRFPGLVGHVQADGNFKLAAGWLIDQCGWKGRSLGAAGVHERQALVLVNRGNANGTEVLALAHAIQDDVQQRFGILLEPEPVIL